MQIIQPQKIEKQPLFQKTKRYLKSKDKNISLMQECMDIHKLLGTKIPVVPNAYSRLDPISLPKVQLK